MTRMQFLSDLATAKPGDWIIYHTGYLFRDREFGPDFQNVHAVATAAYDAYDEARVTLVQRRIGPGVYAYCAIKLDYDAHKRADQKAGSHYNTKKHRDPSKKYRESKKHRYAAALPSQ